MSLLIVVLQVARAVAVGGLAATALVVAVAAVQLYIDLRRPPARHRSLPRHTLGRS